MSQFRQKFVKYELINPNIIIFTLAYVAKVSHKLLRMAKSINISRAYTVNYNLRDITNV